MKRSRRHDCRTPGAGSRKVSFGSVTVDRSVAQLRPALLNPCYWPEVSRGSERFVRELANGLIARGDRPTLITSHRGKPTRTTEDGLSVKRNRRLAAERLDRRKFEVYLTHVPFSYVSLRRGDYDLAHALHVTDALAANRWARRTGRPSILSYMGIPDHPGLSDRRLRLEITQRAVAECDAVLTLSQAAADAFQRWLGVDAQVIYPGVDLEAFRLSEQRAAEPTIFCGAAIEEPRKRVGLLIAAARLVRRERPNLRLLLSRPNDQRVADSVARSDAGVELVDVGDRADLFASCYQQAWVSVLPSFGEAFGIVLIEALSCGTPVVATNLGGMREIIDRDTIGRLFDGGPESLARSLLEALELAENPATAHACRARAEEFSTDRCVDAYLRLYRDLVDGRR